MGTGASAQVKDAFDKAEISQGVEAGAKWISDNRAVPGDLLDEEAFTDFADAAGLTSLEKKRLNRVKEEFLAKKPRRLEQAESELLGIGVQWFLTSFHQEAVRRGRKTNEAVWLMNFHELVHVVGIGSDGLGKGKCCPRDGLQDSSIVDAVWEEGHSKLADYFLSWCWAYGLRMVCTFLRFSDCHDSFHSLLLLVLLLVTMLISEVLTGRLVANQIKTRARKYHH